MKRKTALAKARQKRLKDQLRPKPEDQKQPFLEHLYELRQRLFKVALSVIVFSTLGYFIQQQLVRALLKPAHGQQFIYTSPIGGLNFLFSVCLYFGFVLSIPVLVYELLKYLEPLIREHTKHLVIRYSIVSGLLAVGGGLFGYFLGLPIALRFLSHQFTTNQIHPLLTIQEYMGFVTIYLLGSALLFQLPVIILFINHIKPLKPSKLLSFERYMVLISFCAAAIMTPTTDIFDQLVFAIPIMVMYQLAILLVYMRNRDYAAKRSKHVVKMLEHDAQVQAQRQPGTPMYKAEQLPSPGPAATAPPRPQAADGHSAAWDVF